MIESKTSDDVASVILSDSECKASHMRLKTDHGRAEYKYCIYRTGYLIRIHWGPFRYSDLPRSTFGCF